MPPKSCLSSSVVAVEPVFQQERDKLFHLDLDDSVVALDEVDFVKYGSANDWLMSEIFGLSHARSVPAEKAIEDAKALQLTKSPSKSEVAAVHKSLVGNLRDDDAFWPRWLFFAEKHGVIK